MTYSIMATNSGLKSVNCDTLSVDYTISLQDTTGTAGQVLTSNGNNQPVTWDTNAVPTPNPLTAGANITYASGASSWNGSIADTIVSTDTDTTYQEGDGIEIDTATNPDTIKVRPDTITLDFAAGELEVKKVPNSLTAGTGVSFSSGTTYDGSSAITINTSPYEVFDVYDPATVDSDALSTSYAQIFSGNLSNTFTAKTTAVEVQLQIFNYTSSSNRWIYLRLSDLYGTEWSVGMAGGGYGTGTRDTERNINYADENDKQTIVMSWYLQGLSIGSSYTVNPYAKTSSTWNYIYAGGSYPACILKVINL